MSNVRLAAIDDFIHEFQAHRRRALCPNEKTGYPSRKAAELALAGLREKRGRVGDVGRKWPVRVYECRCGFWHLTAMEKG